MFLDHLVFMETISNLKYSLLHNKIIYDFPSRLQDLATVKVACNLWYEQEDIGIGNNELQRKIQRKIPLLEIPKSLKEDVALMAELSGNEINELSKVVDRTMNFTNQWLLLRGRIYWTSEATIDKKRTVEAFADCKDLDLGTRFEIALEFYLDDRINSLSIRLPPDYVKNNGIRYPSLYIMNSVSTARKHFGISSWTSSNYTERFMKALKRNNEIECHFYWQCLTKQEKSEFAWGLLHHCENRQNIFLHVFTDLEQDQKLQLLRNEYLVCCLLRALLDMRWIKFFSIGTKEMGHCLRSFYFLTIIEIGLEKLIVSYVYKKKYRQVCVLLIKCLNNENSASFRRHNCHIIQSIMSTLVENEESYLINVFLDSMSTENRELMSNYLPDKK